MGKWTQGPWRWSDDYQSRDLTDTWSLLGADGFGILSCDGKCNSPQELNLADARLIAAAPELAEALEMMLRAWEEVGGSDRLIGYQKGVEALAKAGSV